MSVQDDVIQSGLLTLCEANYACCWYLKQSHVWGKVRSVLLTDIYKHKSSSPPPLSLEHFLTHYYSYTIYESHIQ